MRHRGWASLVVAASLSSVVLWLAPAATAQTGPPPGVCVVTSGNQDAGSARVGNTITLRLTPACRFSPGDPVTISVNGRTVLTKAADSQGGVTVIVTVQSTAQLLIDDPVAAPAQCGLNTVVATGFSPSAAATVSQSATFNLDCTVLASHATGATTASGRSSGGGLARTGAEILIWAVIAGAMVALGTLVVTTVRRRRVTDSR